MEGSSVEKEQWSIYLKKKETNECELVPFQMYDLNFEPLLLSVNWHNTDWDTATVLYLLLAYPLVAWQPRSNFKK